MSYTGLTAEICEDAWEIVRSSLGQAYSNGVTNKLAGTIVVLDPWTGLPIFTETLDEDHEKAQVYGEIAFAKARVSWETKMPSREVQQNAPHLYKPGMTKWGGSAYEFGLVVAFSGVQAVYDEAISWSVLAWILAICRDRMTKPDGVMANDSSYIGN